MSECFDLIVVGGGAAGLWAAGTASARGLSVLVLEKNRKLGVKILMSGGTRCNITHHCDAAGIVDAFGREQGRFLKHGVYALPPERIVERMHALGVQTKVEDTGKVFPVSNRAIDVRDALVRRASAGGARLEAGVAVLGVERASDRWKILTDRIGTLEAHQLLICCGGKSYAGCGTTGDGYAWAQQCGHKIIKTRPALTPLVCDESWVHELSGLTLADTMASIEVKSPDEGSATRAKHKQRDQRLCYRGGLLWTHFGFSGPVPMNVSRYVSEVDQATAPENTAGGSEKTDADLKLDFVPDTNEDELVRGFGVGGGGSSGKQSVLVTVQSRVPRRLALALLQRAQVPATTTLAELTKRARQQLIRDLKGLRLPLQGTKGYPKAEVTRGGVSLKEVNPKTCQSRLVPTLYFAGEILDIDGPIGGYNFQAAFATGDLVGRAVEKNADQ